MFKVVLENTVGCLYQGFIHISIPFVKTLSWFRPKIFKREFFENAIIL